MWREVVELSRPKNVVLAAITVPLGAHLALGGDWSFQSLGLVPFRPPLLFVSWQQVTHSMTLQI